jgi:hypothetical protein
MRAEQGKMRSVFCAAVLAATATAPAGAASWHNHIDASMINEIVVRGNELYVATYGGILVYDRTDGSFQQYTNDTGLPSNSLRCLTFTANGDIYAGSADIGVAKVRLSNGHLTLIRSLSEQIDGLASNTVNSIAVWNDVLVYGSTPGAGTIRNDFASARFFERDGLPGPDVFDVLPVGDKVYLATAGGVATLNALGIIQTLPNTPLAAHVLTTDGVFIYAGTSTNVRRFDPATSLWTDIGPNAPATPQRVYGLYWDGTTLWAGGTRSMFRYSGSGTTWTATNASSIQDNYLFSTGTGNVEMRGIVAFGNNDVYFGSASEVDLRGPNLIHYDGANLVNLRANTPGANNIPRLDIDTDGSLWAEFASYYVGKLMPDNQWVNYNKSIAGIELPTNPYANIGFLADSQGHKWFSTLSDPNRPPLKPLDELVDGTDANYSNDVWTRHAENSGGGDTYGSLRPVRAAEDPVGNRWFMSDDDVVAAGKSEWQGFNILNRDGTTWFRMNPLKDPRMVNGNVVDVAFSGAGTFVAFKQQGVYLWGHGGYAFSSLTNYAQDTWAKFVGKGQGQLPSTASITRLALRTDGRLWIGTDSGLFYSSGFGVSTVPTYTGISPGIVSPKVQDIMLDHEENLWVATDLGLNRIARDDNNDIQTFLTPASFAVLSGLRYALDVISPLAHADVRSLAIHPTKDILYIGTFGGLSIYDFSAPAASATDLSKVYVFPNPVYTSKGHASLKVGNITGPVTVEIYDLEGELVDSRQVTTDGGIAWDLKTHNGTDAGSGKYIVRIRGENGSVQRPIALIR